MQLRLRREPTLLGRVTLGDLFVDEQWQCYTLEDAVREVPGIPVFEWKVQDETAIPFGAYRLGLVDSPKFGPDTITLLDVPGFTNVRIHQGNFPEDTDGCILVGATRHGASIGESKLALAALKHIVVPELTAGNEVLLTIESHKTES
jgi:hypothetical protein